MLVIEVRLMLKETLYMDNYCFRPLPKLTCINCRYLNGKEFFFYHDYISSVEPNEVYPVCRYPTCLGGVQK
jgi:hypothetical protein